MDKMELVPFCGKLVLFGHHNPFVCDRNVVFPAIGLCLEIFLDGAIIKAY